MSVEAYLVASLRSHDGFKALRLELEESRQSELEKILEIADERDILFAVAKSRAEKSVLSLIDAILDRADEEVDKIELGEQ